MGTRHGDEKWAGPPFGSGGGRVTWSATRFTDSFNEFDFLMSEQRWLKLVRAGMDAWEAVLDIDLVELPSSRRADIEIGWALIDGPGGTLGRAFTSFERDGTLLRAAVQMDVEERWTTDRNARSEFFNDPDNFYAVMTHEIGHALGVDHIPRRSALMHPFSGKATDLTLTDVKAAVALYGPNPGSSGPGAQIVAGTAGADRLKAGGGADEVHGFGGADTIKGGAGRDRLGGDGGADLLKGGRGGDRLEGDGKGDRLNGGRGDDTLTGGGGPDVFVLSRNGGRDRVEDFRPGRDAVEVASGAGRFAALDIDDVAAGTRVSVKGAKLILRGVEASDLSADDFLF